MNWTELQKRAAAIGSAVLGNWKRAPEVSNSYDPMMYGGQDWNQWIRGNQGGPLLTEKTSRTLAAVHACIQLIGGSIASLPMHFYRRTDVGREKYMPDVWWLFNERPYFNWSAASLWQFISDSRLLHGDAFVRIHRKGPYSPDIAGLEPLHPLYVTVTKSPLGLVYDVRPIDGKGPNVRLGQDDMLHVAGAGFDGVRSMSALRYGLLKAGGIALSADEQAAQFMEDGVRADFALEVPGALSPDQQQVLRSTFLDRHSGAGAKRAPIVLAGGVKLHQLTMSMEDAQLLSTRAFQIEEVCRIFGVPPFMIGHTEKTSSWGTGIEQMSIGFVKYTLAPHLTSIEQEINFKLFKTSRNFCEFVTAGLERGDIKTRYEAHRIGLGRAGEPGWVTVNEVRSLENLPPIGGGDELMKVTPAAPAVTNNYHSIEPQNIKLPDVTLNMAPHTVNLPEMRASDVVVNVAPAVVNVENSIPVPAVHLEAVIPAAQIVMTHPKRAVQTVERDPTTLEIRRTQTEYEG